MEREKKQERKNPQNKTPAQVGGGDRPIVTRLYLGFYYFLFHPFLPSTFPLLPLPASVCCSVVPSVSFDALILSHCDFICSSFLLIVHTDSRVCARGNGSLCRHAQPSRSNAPSTHFSFFFTLFESNALLTCGRERFELRFLKNSE